MIEGIKTCSEPNYFDNFWKTLSIPRVSFGSQATVSDANSISLERIHEMVEFNEHMEKIQKHVNENVIVLRKKEVNENVIVLRKKDSNRK